MKQIGKNVIFRQIQESKFPCWNLYNMTGFRKVLIRSYNCEDLPDDADPDKKVEKSLQNLTLVLGAFPSDMECAIEIKANKTASGTSFLGPIEFINSEFESPTEQQSKEQQPSMMGLGAFGFPNLGELEKYGLCSQREMDAKLAAIEAANTAKLQEMQLDIRRQILEQEYKQKAAALDAEKARLDEKRRETESGINKAVEVVKLAVPALLQGLSGGKINIPETLQGAAQTNEQPTEREKIVEDMASDVFESNLTDEQLRALKKNIYSLIREKNVEVSEEQDTATANSDEE